MQHLVKASQYEKTIDLHSRLLYDIRYLRIHFAGLQSIWRRGAYWGEEVAHGSKSTATPLWPRQSFQLSCTLQQCSAGCVIHGAHCKLQYISAPECRYIRRHTVKVMSLPQKLY